MLTFHKVSLQWWARHCPCQWEKEFKCLFQTRPHSVAFHTWWLLMPLIVVCPARTGIALVSWDCGDVYKCASLCRLMQGRLFVVPWGKDFFIKALRVFTHVCALPEQTGNHSHTRWLRRGLGLLEGQAHLRTFWVSRNRSSVTLLMNPCVIFQLSRGYRAKKLLSVTWQANPSCPESFLSPEPSPSICHHAPPCLNSQLQVPLCFFPLPNSE